MEAAPGDEDDSSAVDEHLADRLGLSVEQLVEILGGGWQRLEDSFGSHPATPEDWYVAGEPAQLMLGLDLASTEETVALARPRGRWSGHQLVYEPTDVHRVAAWDGLAEVAQVVAGLLRRRRAAFRYCRYCRSLTAPERRFDADSCMGCASRWLGVVF